MKRELEVKFYQRWPKWFCGRLQTVQQNLMPFGFDHGDGWADLEWRLCEDIEKILAPTGKSDSYTLVQVKEKFGGLRWYCDAKDISKEAWEAINNRIAEAEAESFKTCEQCGKPGKLRTQRSWVTTLCDEHEEERNEKGRPAHRDQAPSA